jgi:hypothetical protein
MTLPDASPVIPPPARKTTFGRLMGNYALAVLLATILLPIALGLRDLLVLGPSGVAEGLNPKGLLSILTLGYLLIFVFAAPFATALIVLAEMSGRRDRIIYLLGGAIIGPLVGLIAGLLPSVSAEPSQIRWGGLALFAIIGLISANGFWSLAFKPR